MSEVKEGIYRHYKGNLYRVICVAKHSETLEELVVYQDAIDEAKFWARPLSMWDEEVHVCGEKLPRFQFLASSMEGLDQRPMFRLVEAIKDNLEQYQHLGEYNTLRYYHKPTGDILEVDEGLPGLLEDGEDTGDYEPHRVANAGKVLGNREDYLRLPDDDVNAYDRMERFICELPIRNQDDLGRAIRGKGAFRRFKDTAARLGVLDAWYRYLAAAFCREARMWCEANGIAWFKPALLPLSRGPLLPEDVHV